MRSPLIIALLLITSTSIFAQSIKYDIPDGLETAIGKDDYKRIVDMAVPIVKRRYAIDFVKGGTIQLKDGQDMGAFNLDNLIYKCVDEKDKSKWNGVIETHFMAMFNSIDEQKNIDPANYETIRKYLSLRIYSEETIRAQGGADLYVLRADLEGTYTMLMLDLPEAFTPVQQEFFKHWNKTAAEVFAEASANVNRQPVDKVTKSFEFDNVMIEMSLLGNEDYAASFALDLQNNSPELVGEWGSVIAIPNKGLVNICKVSKEKPVDFVKFIQMTKTLIDKAYTTHPQRISDQYFWFYKGTFTKINVDVGKNGDISVIAPIELSNLMVKK